MPHDTNDELRSEREEQERHRQRLRDEEPAAADGESGDVGSQDERRKEGRRL